MEFTVTERGKEMLIKDGYMYVFKKMLANDVQSYECVLRRAGQCNATIKLSPLNEFLEERNVHTHNPSQDKVEVKKVASRIKHRAKNTNDTTQQILGHEIGNISDAAAVNLPAINNIRRNIRRQRDRENMPPIPHQIIDVPAIPNLFRNTIRGERFLLFDSGVGDRDRILIFATDNALQMLGSNSQWFADGTFKVCPEVFFQVYTIHVLINTRVFPCVFALLPNKTQNTYNRLFIEVMNNVRNVGNGPEGVLVDFEMAALNAIRTQINQVEVRGCYYHLCANVYKKVKELGLQERYVNEMDFATAVRMVPALAFVPPADVNASFDALCMEIRNQFGQDLDGVLDYFEDTYVGRLRPNGVRGRPLFNMEIWNMFHRTDDELPRTNNSVEGWHRGFQSQFVAYHPTIWKFIEILQLEENIVHTAVMQNEGGHAPPPQRRRYADANTRILRIVDDYPNRAVLNYLRAISHNIMH